MTAITYVASRNIASGHAVGTTYAIDIDMSAIDRDPKTVRTRHQALSGIAETLFNRVDVSWNFVIAALDMDDVRLAYMREFIDSVSAGESFQIDPYGTVAAPVKVLTCELTSESHKESRQGHRSLFFPFSVRVL